MSKEAIIETSALHVSPLMVGGNVGGAACATEIKSITAVGIGTGVIASVAPDPEACARCPFGELYCDQSVSANN